MDGLPVWNDSHAGLTVAELIGEWAVLTSESISMRVKKSNVEKKGPTNKVRVMKEAEYLQVLVVYKFRSCL